MFCFSQRSLLKSVLVGYLCFVWVVANPCFINGLVAGKHVAEKIMLFAMMKNDSNLFIFIKMLF